MTDARGRIFATVVVLLTACVIPPLDPDGYACPCAPGSGYTCDPATNRCVIDPAPDAGGACDVDGLVSVSDLRLHWATPHTLRWTFSATPRNVASAQTDLIEYRIYVGTDRAAVEALSSSSFGPDENPELGSYYLRASDLDEVTLTTTDGLEPATTYHARLTALDVEGHRTCTSIATGRTNGNLGARVTIFDGNTPDGYLHPGCAAIEPMDGPVGDRRICCVVEAGDTYPLVGTGGQALSAMLTDGQFLTAYVRTELTIESIGGAREAWANAQLGIGPPDPAPAFSVQPLTFAEGTRAYELPLSAFEQPGRPLSAALLRDFGLDLFRMGSEVPVGTRICLGPTHLHY